MNKDIEIRNSGCLQENKLGHMEAKLEEHDKEISEIKSCIELKRRRIDDLEIVDSKTVIQFLNLEKRFERKEEKDNQRHEQMMDTFNKAIKELGTKFNQIDSRLSKIMWTIVGGSVVLSFIFLMLEKIPTIILNLQKFL